MDGLAVPTSIDQDGRRDWEGLRGRRDADKRPMVRSDVSD